MSQATVIRDRRSHLRAGSTWLRTHHVVAWHSCRAVTTDAARARVRVSSVAAEAAGTTTTAAADTAAMDPTIPGRLIQTARFWSIGLDVGSRGVARRHVSAVGAGR
jgi:hypothetical protein